MGRTVSGKELKAGIEEFAYRKNNRILAMLADGKRQPKKGVPVITEKESLISQTKTKVEILKNANLFAPEFKKRAGKKVDTKKVFEKVVGVSAENQSGISA